MHHSRSELQQGARSEAFSAVFFFRDQFASCLGNLSSLDVLGTCISEVAKRALAPSKSSGILELCGGLGDGWAVLPVHGLQQWLPRIKRMIIKN